MNCKHLLDIFRLCPPPPPPPSTLCTRQLQSTCHYMLNLHVKIWHVRLEGANNVHPLSWVNKRKRSHLLYTETLFISRTYALLFRLTNFRKYFFHDLFLYLPSEMKLDTSCIRNIQKHGKSCQDLAI